MRRFRNKKPNYVIFTLSRDISEILLKCPFVHKMSKVLYHNSNNTERALVFFACYRRMVIPNAGILTLAELYARDIDVVIGDLVSCMCESDVWFVPHEIVEVCL